MIKQMIKHYFIPHKENEYNPHFFRNACIGFSTIIVVGLLTLSALGSFALKNTGLLSAIYSSVLVDLTNSDRTAMNLPSVTVNPLLEQAAQAKADDMVKNQYFAHQSPAGLSPWFWISKSGYKFAYAGENLAVHYSESSDVENAWLASPGHRANIMNAKFSEVGIAVAQGQFEGRDTTFVVEMFGRPSGKPVAVKTAVTTTTATSTTKTATTTQATATTTKPTATVSTSTQPAVLGESTTTLTVLSETKDTESGQTLLVVRDENVEVATETPATLGKTHSTFIERMILRFPSMVSIFYEIFAALVIIALIALITIEIKHHKPKSIILGLFLLLIIAGAWYLNSTTSLYQLTQLL